MQTSVNMQEKLHSSSSNEYEEHYHIVIDICKTYSLPNCSTPFPNTK